MGRDPVKLDIQAISGYLQGKVVLVSGGGGLSALSFVVRLRPRDRGS